MKHGVDGKQAAQPDRPDAHAVDRAQQPARFQARRAQHHMQRVTRRAFQPATTQPVIDLGMPDHRLDRLPTFQPFALSRAQRPVLVAMDQFQRRDLGIHAAIPEIGEHGCRFRLSRHVLQQDTCLLELPCQRVPVVRIAGEGTRADDQAALLGDRHARLHAEFIRLSGFTLADTFDLGRVQRVQLCLVLRTLPPDPPGARQPRIQRRLMRLGGRSDLSQQSTEERTLPFQYPAQPFVLLRMRVAASAAPQSLALTLVRPLERKPCALGKHDELRSCYLQQSAVGREGDRLLLHCRVDDHAFELVGCDDLHVRSQRDRRGSSSSTPASPSAVSDSARPFPCSRAWVMMVMAWWSPCRSREIVSAIGDHGHDPSKSIQIYPVDGVGGVTGFSLSATFQAAIRRCGRSCDQRCGSGLSTPIGKSFVAQWLAYVRPCQRFGDTLASAPA